jgi:K+-sensing histidine kinase KdpD
MIYLLGVFLVASQFGRGASITASFLTALLFDFYFTKPYFSFAISHIENIIEISTMLIVSIITSNLLDKAQKAAIAKAQADNEALRNSLLSAISHDLRTPLTRIIGAATTLMETHPNISKKEQHEFCCAIFDESQRMAELMNKILEMAKMSTGEIAIHCEWNTVEEIIGSTLIRLEKSLSQRQVNIQIPPDSPLIWVDAVLFEQVILNLIENAIKYTPANTPIDIDVTHSKHTLTISIADHGLGIPVALHQKVFEKFYRISSETENNGVGLGLTLCQTIVQAHGGTIEVQQHSSSTGAVFVIALPLSKPPTISFE